MTDEQIAVLRAAATHLLPHYEGPPDYDVYVDAPDDVVFATRDYLTAANPAAVLSLLDRLARVEAERDRMREAVRSALLHLDAEMGDTDPQVDTPLLLAHQVLAALVGEPRA